MLRHKLKQYTTELSTQGLYRQRRVSDADEPLINFSSNDYLSLASDPRIKKAYQHGFEHYPTGSGGSMMVCGYHSNHKALEQAFSEVLDVDDCILFTSGFAANLSVIGLLARFDTHVLIDKMVHASIYDGLQLSGTAYSRYLHNNLADVVLKMKNFPKNSVLMTEGIFSMSGQYAPLAEIAELSQDFIQGLVVDEAHSFGILGREGLGAVVAHQLTQDDVPLRVIPLGKAYAASGAIVAGQGVWIDALLQSARPQIYSTALSPAYAYGLLETLENIRRADERRDKLAELIRYFRDAIKKSPLTWRDSSSLIQQLQLGCPQRALYFAGKLREQSILCIPMRQPTVSRQETGLRVILNYHHQPEHIDALFECLHRC
ncbi:MAG: aminotransferase class I/II-fold pyridoxal phosphate-dependent enzyme [Legionellales bacterium]|nr:aminotransferase class I/II-fold pyridoxal phosphate-dependent enzyme [Legionellales bacterium]